MAAPIPQPVVIDFETHPILPRPEYPPRPVGVAIHVPGRSTKYFAFGHPTGNNSTVEAAQAELRAVWDHPEGLLFHNGKFDIDVAETHLGMPRLPWQRYHDTLFQLFLTDPHAATFALKPSSERLLGQAPDEATELHDWLVQHRVVQKGVKGWGAFIAQAPGDLVGRYAMGDVKRTAGLFQLLMPEIIRRGMVEPYDRERELMTILLDNERQGIPVALQELSEDVGMYTRAQEELEAWIIRTLGAPNLNLDAGRDLLDALRRANKIDLDLLELSPTGKHKFDKENLARAVLDPTLKAVLGYRASLKTCLATFMTPWLRQAEATGGRIHTSWSQTRNFEKGKSAGAVTGRLSSSPNFQNIPGGFPDFFPQGTPPPFALPALPRVRRYIVPEYGQILVDRDYSQQELRILAEYASGALFDAYASKPDLDLHEMVRAQLSELLGYRLERKPVKTVVFGLIYGMGVGRMADSGGVDIATARALKEGVLALFPGIREINQAMRTKAERRQPLRTWGGREYYCEPPKYQDGEMRSFEYKMINVLIQGSAADCTKEALINYHRSPHHGNLLLSVHDEILLSVPKDRVAEEMDVLEAAMSSVAFDVPMLSDGKAGNNWGEMGAWH